MPERPETPPGRPLLTRRRFVAAGTGAFAGVAALLYGRLVVGDEFEELVGSKLGVDADLAAKLLDRVRERYGDLEYEARAAAFALAVREPLSALVPTSLKRSATEPFLVPMFDTPAAGLAYAEGGGRDPNVPACLGLVKVS